MRRDVTAKFKLLGGALRLRDFTAHELAEHTGVHIETVKDFLQSDLVDGVIDRTPKPGRPRMRCHLNAAGREVAAQKLGELRKYLPQPKFEESDPPAFAMLDATALAIQKSTGDSKRRQTALRRLPMHILGARAALRDCEAAGASDTYLYALSARIERAQSVEVRARIEDALVRPELSPPQERDEVRTAVAEIKKVGERIRNSWLHGINEFVAKHGKWVGDPNTEPVAFVFDGIKGDDPLTKRVIDAYRDLGMCVARFDLTSQQTKARQTLLGNLDYLLQYAPATLAKCALTIDGTQQSATDVAKEFSFFGHRGFWSRASQVKKPPGAVSEIEAIPAQIILGLARQLRSVAMHGANSTGVVDSNLNLALAMIGTGLNLNVSKEESLRPSSDGSEMSVYCFDTKASREIDALIAKRHAHYVPNAMTKNIATVDVEIGVQAQQAVSA